MNVNNSGEMLIGGSFTSDIDMDPGTNTFSLTANEACYLGKYNTNGNLMWATKLNSQGNQDQLNDITADASGNIYTCGPAFNANTIMSRICKWNNNGNLQWIKYFDAGLPYGAFYTKIGCNNTLMVHGLGYSGDNFDTSGGTYTCSPTNDPNMLISNGVVFAASYDLGSGNINWANSVGGNLYWNYDINYSIGAPTLNPKYKISYVDNNGNIYIHGQFMQGDLPNDFNPDPVVTTSLNTTNNFSFFGKYSGCNAVGVTEYNIINNLEVFPNPSTGQFTFEGLTETCSIEVTDLTGRIIFSEKMDQSKHTINLVGKEKGIYIYKIKNKENKVQQGKLVLQ
jgi:hypothetical protein